MEPRLSRSGHDARRRRHAHSSRDDLRDERRKLSTKDRPAAAIKSRTSSHLRDNQEHRQIVAPRQSTKNIGLASDNQTRQSCRATTILSHPDCRCPLIQIVAPYAAGVDAIPVHSCEEGLAKIGAELRKDDAVLFLTSGDIGGLIERLPLLAEKQFPILGPA